MAVPECTYLFLSLISHMQRHSQTQGWWRDYYETHPRKGTHSWQRCLGTGEVTKVQKALQGVLDPPFCGDKGRTQADLNYGN